MKNVMRLNKKSFLYLVNNPILSPIDNDSRLKNLSQRYWVYDVLLAKLAEGGWVRIAPGFKAGLYAHPQKKWCIKVMGMGVGDDPLYFCEKGYFLEHEREMLQLFAEKGFSFQPKVKDKQETIEFLMNECGVDEEQATLRSENNDVLVIEYIPGIPYATQTGHFLDYDINICIFDDDVINEMVHALIDLKTQVYLANAKKLLHNDLVPPNIIFTCDSSDKIIARLVDFELSTNVNCDPPEYVSHSIAELNKIRHVPKDMKKNKTLDNYLLDESINMAKEIRLIAEEILKLQTAKHCITITIPFIGGIGVNMGHARSYLQHFSRGDTILKVKQPALSTNA